MLHKTIIPYPDGRYTVHGLYEDRGQLIDRLPRSQGMMYKFDFSELFTETLDYCAVTRGPGVLGELGDCEVSLFFDGSIHRTDGLPSDDYGIRHTSGGTQIDLTFYTHSGENWVTSLVIEESTPGGRPIAGPQVDADGFLVGPDGFVTNEHGWWLRYARKVRRVEVLQELVFPLLVGENTILTTDGGDSMLVYKPNEYVFGGDTLKPTICRTKAEFDETILHTGFGPLMVDEKTPLAWGKNPVDDVPESADDYEL